MKAPVLVTVVVFLHAMVFGTLVFVQGCGTPQPKIEPPPAPVMPPPAAPEKSAMLPPARPVDLSPAFPSGKPRLPPKPVEIASQEYVIQSGDSLSVVAHRHGLKTRELAEINGIKDVNKVHIGQKIMIPGPGGAADPGAPAKKPAKNPAPTELTGSEYLVQPGDYLGKIAQKFGVKLAALREANNLTSDVLRPGQKLVLPSGSAKKPEAKPMSPVDGAPVPPPAPAPVPDVAPMAPVPTPTIEVAPPPAPPPAPAGKPIGVAPVPVPPVGPSLGSSHQPIKYPVGQGETLESIAKAFLVTPEGLSKLNNITDPKSVKPGMTILIPVPE